LESKEQIVLNNSKKLLSMAAKSDLNENEGIMNE
jgi:hypothetical protein